MTNSLRMDAITAAFLAVEGGFGTGTLLVPPTLELHELQFTDIFALLQRAFPKQVHQLPPQDYASWDTK